MPLKEFKCTVCEEIFEHLTRTNTIAICPKCGSTNVTPILSAFGGYHIVGRNPASVRPRGAGSRMKGSK